MGPPRAPHRDLDRLRGLSPLSQNWRRTPGMNPRTPLVLSPRGGGSISSASHTSTNTALTPKASHKSVREPATPTTPSRPRLLRSASRPARVLVPSAANPAPATAAVVTPRKGSAPSKLISNNQGGSLENLPNTVSTRRKTSAPAKSAVPNTNARKNSAVIPARPRKSSAPTISTRVDVNMWMIFGWSVIVAPGFSRLFLFSLTVSIFVWGCTVFPVMELPLGGRHGVM